MSELLALGASHKTAPLAVRERLALLDGQVEPFLQELVAHPDDHRGRRGLHLQPHRALRRRRRPGVGRAAVLAMLARRAGTPLGDAVYGSRNCDAARHLYRVVSGLESMIVGEAEIQGQVKRAYERALAARTTGPLTNKLFRAALATGKRVRTETAISTGNASVASVAVESARAAVGELAERHVVIVGAGETSEQTARAFHAHGVTTMFVANRRRERAIALAQQFGGVLGLVRRAARRAGARRRRRLLHRLAARDHRAPRSSAAVMEAARRPAAAAGRPRRAARHRPAVRDASTA